MVTTVLTSCNNNRLLTDTTNIIQPLRSLTVQPVEKAKRCLFGVPDRQTTRADLSTLRRQLDTQSRQRWNFDFRSGVPLTSLPLSTATSGGVRWVWTRVSDETLSSRCGTDSQSDGTARRDVRRRYSLTHHTQASSPSPLPDRSKRPRMSLTPSVEVKAKVTRSEVKVISRRKSVGGLERRRLLRSTSLLGSPSRMFNAFFFTRSRSCCTSVG